MNIDIKDRLMRFVPTELGVEETAIAAPLRPVVAKLVKASNIIDRLYLTQVSKDNLELRASLSATEPPHVLEYFDIMYGPWDRTDGNRPFIGSKSKPPGAGFYPDGMTRRTFEAWLEAHPADRASFESYFTVIESRQQGLAARPYSETYRAHLGPTASVLRTAASLSTDPRLAAYLRARADAFHTNEYRESDLAWMDLGDGALEVVIGPYEVYEDALLGLKAAFEAIIAIRNHEETARLEWLKQLLPELEAALPIPEAYKNPNRGTDSPLAVVDVLMTAGDTRAGVQTMAFNLPNDEVARELKGSKKVLFKNVARAKFDEILRPIADALIHPSQLPEVTFEAFFNHTLLHEAAHGLGPGRLTIAGEEGELQETTVNHALRDLYATIEEAKADILGMYLNYLLIERSFHPKAFEAQVHATFLAGFFRSVRFGLHEAHGRANIIQFNFLWDRGAIAADGSGRFRVATERMRGAITALAAQLLTIEAEGDYDGAAALAEQYGRSNEVLEQAVARLVHIPTDIRPVYTIERQIAAWYPSWLP